MIKSIYFLFFDYLTNGIIFFIYRVRSMISNGTLFIGLGTSHPGSINKYDRLRDSKTKIPSVIGVYFFVVMYV